MFVVYNPQLFIVFHKNLVVEMKLEGTGQIRKIGVVSDKITPNKRTGHIIAATVPVPDNPLSGNFLFTVFLAVTPVKDHTADGLACQMLDFLRQSGIDDTQLSGFGVDSQYIKMGVLNKLIEKINLEEKDLNKLKGWILQACEPARNLNLTVIEVREKSEFH